MAGEIAAADHRHPGVLAASRQQLAHHRFTHSIAGATDAAHPLINQVILEQLPAEFVGELKSLDQALFLQFAERSLPCRLKRPLQRGQRPPVVLQPLQPTHIRGSHGG